MSRLTVAQLLVETLARAGVRNIYGLPGDSLNGITDSIRTHPDLRWVHVRHEETAAFAAGAEAHLTGKVAVCAGSCGPGNLHLINGLYDCYRSRVPVVAIAAQIPSSEIGSRYFQETNPQHIFAQCSDYCESISEPEQMPRVLDIALQTAIAKQTVAVVTIPGDVALKPAVVQASSVRIISPNPVLRPSDEEMASLAKLLNENERITILAGAGCAGAHDELVALAAALKAPVVHALRGKEFVEYDNPYDVGMTGLIGFSSGYYAMADCDLLLMLGTDFPYRQFYPEHALVVQIDCRGEQLGRRAKLDLGLVGDIKQTISALLPLLGPHEGQRRLDSAIHHYTRVRKGLDDLASERTLTGKTHPQLVASLISELATDDAIFTCDVGAPTVWAARYLKMNGKRRLLGSFNHGSMANALPQAIGAQVSHPGRQVISLSGDGGLAMLLGDLLTLRQLNLPVKVVVFNNEALAFVELEMKAAGFVEFGTDLKNPDFAKLAEAAGIAGFSAETPEQVRGAISTALQHDGPAAVSVSVARQELSMPPTITFEQAKGFGLFFAQSGSGRQSERYFGPRGHEPVALAFRRWWGQARLLQHGARSTLSALSSLAVASLLTMPEAYWAAITTLVVMQSDVGSTLGVSARRLIGTAMGAILGALLYQWFGVNGWAFGGGMLVCGLACMAVGRIDKKLSGYAEKTVYRFACITLAVVLLIPRSRNVWSIAMDRFIEVSVGIVVALAFTRLWPEGAQPAPAVSGD